MALRRLAQHELTLKNRSFVPIVIGGMGVNISSASLAHVAADLGGIGHISDAMAPYISDQEMKTNLQSAKGKHFRSFRDQFPKPEVKWRESDAYLANKNYVEQTMSSKQGPGGIFINVMEKLGMGAPTETLRGRLRGALDGGIDGITLSAGLHTGSLRLISDHPRFHDAYLGIIVSSARALKIFLRGAAREDRLPDYIVVEGPLAGGHLGFGEDWKKYRLSNIVEEVLAFLRKQNLNIPVIPAGGIFTGTDAVDFINRGAAAVQVATRFTIAQECGLPEAAKQKYLHAREEDVVVNGVSPTGYLMRMLKSSPCLTSNIRPQCESLGYMLGSKGDCPYQDAYLATKTEETGKKLPVTEKMCICYHFMRSSCYTCGHFVYRLKDTTIQNADGSYFMPSAEHIFQDYLTSEDHQISLPRQREDSHQQLAMP